MREVEAGRPGRLVQSGVEAALVADRGADVADRGAPAVDAGQLDGVVHQGVELNRVRRPERYPPEVARIVGASVAMRGQ